MKYLTTLILLFTFLGPSLAYAGSEVVTVRVHGLVCDFCARALEKVFGKQEAVQSIDVNLDSKIITIEFKDGQNLSDQQIGQFVEDAGYNTVEITRGEKHE